VVQELEKSREKLAGGPGKCPVQRRTVGGAEDTALVFVALWRQGRGMWAPVGCPAGAIEWGRVLGIVRIRG